MNRQVPEWYKKDTTPAQNRLYERLQLLGDNVALKAFFDVVREIPAIEFIGEFEKRERPDGRKFVYGHDQCRLVIRYQGAEVNCHVLPHPSIVEMPKELIGGEGE